MKASKRCPHSRWEKRSATKSCAGAERELLRGDCTIPRDGRSLDGQALDGRSEAPAAAASPKLPGVPSSGGGHKSELARPTKDSLSERRPDRNVGGARPSGRWRPWPRRWHAMFVERNLHDGPQEVAMRDAGPAAARCAEFDKNRAENKPADAARAKDGDRSGDAEKERLAGGRVMGKGGGGFQPDDSLAKKGSGDVNDAPGGGGQSVDPFVANDENRLRDPWASFIPCNANRPIRRFSIDGCAPSATRSPCGNNRLNYRLRISPHSNKCARRGGRPATVQPNPTQLRMARAAATASARAGRGPGGNCGTGGEQPHRRDRYRQ